MGTSWGFRAKCRQLKHLNRYRTHSGGDLHNLVGGRYERKHSLGPDSLKDHLSDLCRKLYLRSKGDNLIKQGLAYSSRTGGSLLKNDTASCLRGWQITKANIYCGFVLLLFPVLVLLLSCLVSWNEQTYYMHTYKCLIYANVTCFISFMQMLYHYY